MKLAQSYLSACVTRTNSFAGNRLHYIAASRGAAYRERSVAARNVPTRFHVPYITYRRRSITASRSDVNCFLLYGALKRASSRGNVVSFKNLLEHRRSEAPWAFWRSRWDSTFFRRLSSSTAPQAKEWTNVRNPSSPFRDADWNGPRNYSKITRAGRATFGRISLRDTRV